jgi:dihydrofolate reductase
MQSTRPYGHCRRSPIDEYLLMIHPLVLGTGRRLFPEGGRASLRLTDSVITTKGVLMATYELDRD